MALRNSMCSLLSVFATSAAALRLPPSMPVYSQPLGVMRESIAYLKDPDAFVAKRAETLGPVFLAGMFFRPTVFVGGPEAVDEFINTERVITESSLPQTFEVLHTRYGSLNQQGETHAASRQAFVPMLQTARLREYLPLMEARTTAYIDSLAAGSRCETRLACDAKRFYLDLMAELFTGTALSDVEAQAFVDYNAGLLSLGKWAPQFKKGAKALSALQEVMTTRLHRARAEGLESLPRYTVLKQMTECREADGTLWSDERIATAMVIFIWGSYVEVASLSSMAIVALGQRPDLIHEVHSEVAAAGLLRRPLPSTSPLAAEADPAEGTATGTLAIENDLMAANWSRWALPFTTGVLSASRFASSLLPAAVSASPPSTSISLAMTLRPGLSSPRTLAFRISWLSSMPSQVSSSRAGGSCLPRRVPTRRLWRAPLPRTARLRGSLVRSAPMDGTPEASGPTAARECRSLSSSPASLSLGGWSASRAGPPQTALPRRRSMS